MRHFTLIALIFLFAIVLTFGQTTLTETSDNIHFMMEAPETLEVGEQFRLCFTLNKSGTDFKLPDLPNFDVLMGPSTSQSSSMQTINGQLTQLSSFSYIFILRAKKEGKINISPASIRVDGKTYKSNELSIQIVKGQSQQTVEKQPTGKENAQHTEIKTAKDLHYRLIAKYGDYWGDLIYKKEYTLGMTKQMILEFSSEKLYKISKVIRNGSTIEIWEFDRHKMELETLKDGGEDGAKALLAISLLENLGFGNINSQFPNLEFTNGKLTGIFQN